MIKRETGYDKTQWELTKWADEAAKPTEVPGENRQEEGEKGDYLLDLPLVSLILNGVELLFILLTFIFVAIASGMTYFGAWVTSLNMILCCTGIGFVTFWQFRHKDIAEEESKQGTKYYYVKGFAKKMVSL